MNQAPANLKPKKSFGPESDFFQKLKGQVIEVSLRTGQLWRGKLLWVDRYSIGIKPSPAPGHGAPSEVLFFKAGIESLNAVGYECAPGDENAIVTNRPASAP